MKFKTIEEATAAFEKEKSDAKKAKDGLIAELKSIKKELAAEKEAHKATTDELLEAQKVATEALATFNSREKSSEDVIVKHGKKQYKVVYGVNGLTKEELAKNTELISEMLANGTSALEEVK